MHGQEITQTIQYNLVHSIQQRFHYLHTIKAQCCVSATLRATKFHRVSTPEMLRETLQRNSILNLKVLRSTLRETVAGVNNTRYVVAGNFASVPFDLLRNRLVPSRRKALRNEKSVTSR